jgi:hypothetical protein
MKNTGVKRWLLSGLRDISSMKSGENFCVASPAQISGRHQVLPVCADVLNGFEGICFEVGVQGMSDGGRGKDARRAKRQERRSFGESFPSG